MAIHRNKLSKRERRRRRAEERRRKEEAARNKKPWWRHISRVWATVAAFALLLGLVTSYFALVPKVTVVLGEPMLAHDPLSVPLIVTNENPFTIYNVTTRCSLENMVGVTVPVHLEDGSQLITPVNHAATEYTPPQDMPSGDKLTVACSGFNRGPNGYDISKLSNAEIILTVKFRPFWFFWELNRQFHYGTVPSANGKFSLTPMPARDSLTE